MKINNDPMARLKEVLGRLEEPERTKDGAKARGGTAAGSKQDEVQLSPQAHEMQRLRDEVMASPELRQALVDQVREEIASGRYRADGTRIADAILNEELP
jgi:flagellar biosynthesis anti-sigma factor FlgM